MSSIHQDATKARQYLKIFQSAFDDLVNYQIYFNHFGDNIDVRREHPVLQKIHQLVDDIFYRDTVDSDKDIFTVKQLLKEGILMLEKFLQDTKGDKKLLK